MATATPTDADIYRNLRRVLLGACFAEEEARDFLVSAGLVEETGRGRGWYRLTPEGCERFGELRDRGV